MREWRYLQGERREEFVAERRRYEERFRALFREGRELGELRTDLDDATAALLALSAANWAYTWLASGRQDRRARRPLHGASARRDARLREPMNVALVVNPFATRVTEERLEQVREELARVAELDVVLTERPGHATELVTEAGRGGADAVVVFSGDGGFNEALNGLERDVPIGFLPGGGRACCRARSGSPATPSLRRGRWRTRWRRAARAGSRLAASTAGDSDSPPESGCPPRSSGA